MIEKWTQQVRYAARMMANNVGFTAVAVLTLALGIGANTAIFSIVYSTLLRGLPYHDAGRLVTLAEGRQQTSGVGALTIVSSHPDFLDWRRTAKSYQSLAGYGGDGFTLTGNGDPKSVNAVQVTSNFLSMLGVKPMLGRDFVDGEEQADGPHVVLLKYSFWRSEFGGDPGIVGRTIRLDSKPATVIGILPREFEFAPSRSAPLWVPLHLSPDMDTRRSLRWMQVIGRLAPGVSFQQARAEMDGITAQLAREYPKEDGSTFVGMQGLRESIIGPVRPVLLVLFGAVGFVLLIACANVANLLMSRSINRRKEFAIRTALGASRENIVSQLLVESVLLAAVGAGFGLLAAQWGVRFLVDAIPESQLQAMPFLRDAGFNGPVLLFLCGATLLTAVVFGIAPAISASRSPVNDVLKNESRGGTSLGHSRLRNAFVVAEIAISLVLLIGAGLLLRSLRTLLHQNPGFDSSHVLTFSVNLPTDSYPTQLEWPNDSPKSAEFKKVFTERLSDLPGVQSVGVVDGIPMSSGGSIRFLIEGRPKPVGHDDECDIRGADFNYFSTMKVRFVAGRYFAKTDTEDIPWSMIVNESFVKQYFPNENPLGKRVRFTYNAKEPYREIVGVVGNIAEDDLAAPPPAVIYVSVDQNPSSSHSYVLRTAGDPLAFIGAARAALAEIDPQLALVQPQPMARIASESPSVFLRRYPSYIIGSFAALALVLAMVGLYGLISYGVTQRTREIGIRVALGAQRSDILRMVIAQGSGAALAGIALGVVAGFALTRVMASLLYGVTATDGLTFVSVAGLLAIVALVACLIPARRATRVDPIVALRYE
ncbi:MAG: ABC transporter permease [Candidatus Acidiferrales bacterium]